MNNRYQRKPIISLGLPVYNGEKYLEETLKSIITQDFSDFELIISDNASKDGTQRICEEYSKKDRRIHYYRSEKNLGAAPNYNRVFELSIGKYFKWTAHDDIILPNYLSECYDTLEKNKNVVLCYTRSKVIDNNSSILYEDKYGENIFVNSPHLRYRNIVLGLTNYERIPIVIFGLIRSNILRKTGLIGSYPSSDIVLLAELGLYGDFYEIDEPLFLWRYHSEQSVRGELASERNRIVWFDTNYINKTPPQKWMQLNGLVRSIRSSNINIISKILCSLYVLRWILYKQNFKSILKDALLSITGLL